MNENLQLISEINKLINRKNKMKSSNIKRDQNNMKSNSVSKRSFSSKTLPNHPEYEGMDEHDP